uniref:Uncharacterized protein n=1 Tax=Octopus bimaculoides TaxID=37653 RepID=A0A0L8IE93_OCTBM
MEYNIRILIMLIIKRHAVKYMWEDPGCSYKLKIDKACLLNVRIDIVIIK